MHGLDVDLLVVVDAAGNREAMPIERGSQLRRRRQHVRRHDVVGAMNGRQRRASLPMPDVDPRHGDRRKDRRSCLNDPKFVRLIWIFCFQRRD